MTGNRIAYFQKEAMEQTSARMAEVDARLARIEAKLDRLLEAGGTPAEAEPKVRKGTPR